MQIANTHDPENNLGEDILCLNETILALVHTNRYQLIMSLIQKYSVVVV